MVILDDDSARGFLFSYEKLFGAKDKTVADLKNEKAGNEKALIGYYCHFPGASCAGRF
jgi:DNA helicase-2/ATP-dependent DNA helicase PcrA